MSIKENISRKFLNKSKSFNYFKINTQKLSNENNNVKKEIYRLNKEIESKNIQIIELKNELYNMDEGFIFSIVMAVYNTEKYLSEAIDSIINQTFNFDKVQIILVDDGSTDKSKEICLNYVEKYPNNIKYIYQENQGQSVARNNGLKIVDGKFINFLDSDDKLELNALEEVFINFLKFGEEIDVISIPRHTFEAISTLMPFSDKYTESCIIDITKRFDFPITPINSAFIRKNAITNLKFDKRVSISEDSLLINKIILGKCKFGIVSSTKYLYRKRFEENSTIDTKKMDKSYYNPRMKFYYKELIRYSIEKYGYVLKYIQAVLISDLRWQFQQRGEKIVLNEDECNEYYTHIRDVLEYIDEDVIYLQDISEKVKIEMVDLKNGMSF